MHPLGDKKNNEASEIWRQCFLRGQIYGVNELKKSGKSKFETFLESISGISSFIKNFLVNDWHGIESPSNSQKNPLSLHPFLTIADLFKEEEMYERYND